MVCPTLRPNWTWSLRRRSVVDEVLEICFYAFMRTTVELPPELMRAAKARSAERGESLKSLLTRAVAAELGMSAVSARKPAGRVQLPLLASSKRPRLRITNRFLEEALAAADAEEMAAKMGVTGRRRSRPRS